MRKRILVSGRIQSLEGGGGGGGVMGREGGLLSGRQCCNLHALRGHILHIELSSLRGRILVMRTSTG